MWGRKARHHYPAPSSSTLTSGQLPGSREKNLALHDPVAPRYGRLSETDLGEKVHFFNRGRYGIWRCANTTLRYEVNLRPNRSPTTAFQSVLCGFVLAFVWS